MDLGFFRRARAGSADASSAELDHGMLTAALQAFQASSITARLQAEAPGAAPQVDGSNPPLVEVLTGGPDWKEAVTRQGGSFNPSCARAKGQGS